MFKSYCKGGDGRYIIIVFSRYLLIVVLVIYSLLKMTAEKGACRKRKWSKTGSLSLLCYCVHTHTVTRIVAARHRPLTCALARAVYQRIQYKVALLM